MRPVRPSMLGGTSALLFGLLRVRGKIADPGLSRLTPNLDLRLQLMPLANGSPSQAEKRVGIILGAGIDAGAARATEIELPFAAAFCCLFVDGQVAGFQMELVVNHARDDTIGGRRVYLAVGTMADGHPLRVNFGLIGDLATQASAVDFHVRLHKL